MFHSISSRISNILFSNCCAHNSVFENVDNIKDEECFFKFKTTSEKVNKSIINTDLGNLSNIYTEDENSHLLQKDASQTTEKLNHLIDGRDLYIDEKKTQPLENLEQAEKHKENIETLNEETMGKCYGHFYQIVDSSNVTKGYLMGTIHLMHNALLPMKKEIHQAIDQSDRLFLESKISYEVYRKAGARSLEMLRNALSTELSEETVDLRTKQYLESINMSLSQYNDLIKRSIRDALLVYKDILSEDSELNEKLKDLSPIEAIIRCYTAYMDLIVKKTCPPNFPSNEAGLDYWLNQQFFQMEKPVYALETEEAREESLNALFSDPHVLVALINGCLYPNLEKAEMDISSCIEQFIPAPLKIEKHEKGTLEYEMFEKRSKKMGKRIVQDLTENKEGLGFYACGAIHLYDAKNVIQQLKRNKFSVVQI